MADWVAAVSSLCSAIAAILSLLAFLSAMKMQKADAINDVRPELLILDWKIEDKPESNIGSYTSVKAAKIKNVGRGPAFGISYTALNPKKLKQQIYGAIIICPYVAAGGEEEVEIGLLVSWNDLPPEKDTEDIDLRLFYSDLGQRQHSVRMHVVVAKTTNFSYGGAKLLTQRVFMVRRETTVIEQKLWVRLRGRAKRLWASWLKATDHGLQG